MQHERPNGIVCFAFLNEKIRRLSNPTETSGYGSEIVDPDDDNTLQDVVFKNTVKTYKARALKKSQYACSARICDGQKSVC